MKSEGNGDLKTYSIIGAAMAVHKELGHGFLEAVYQLAFENELRIQAIPYQKEVQLPIYYKGNLLPITYRADFICHDTILVELKAISKLTNIEDSQIINYLKATRHTVGLLLNFGGRSLEYKRRIFTQTHPRESSNLRIKRSD